MSEEERLLKEIQRNPLPRHIAIIMDGNGRWAKKRGLPRIMGHRAGTESGKEAVKACGELGVTALTLFTFSTENWSRPRTEIDALMKLLCSMLRHEVSELDKRGVQLRSIGRIEALPESVRKELDRAADVLKHNDGLILNLALNYGGRQEIVDATNKILKSGVRTVNENTFNRYLYTADLPEPDLLIRTSGEQRISNFLLFQLAYAEFYFTPTLWPDFRREDLYRAIQEFQKRDRRFGGTVPVPQR